MELGSLSYRDGAIEDYLGSRGLQKLGKKKWRDAVAFWVKRLTSALLLDDVVIGGGNAKKLKLVPLGCRLEATRRRSLGGAECGSRGPVATLRPRNALLMAREKKQINSCCNQAALRSRVGLEAAPKMVLLR